MGMHIDTSGFHPGAAMLDNADDAVRAGAQVILDAALEHVPKEIGDLAASGGLSDVRNSGAYSTISIEFTSVYARYQHEHLHFKHPHGGTAKFLELATIEKGAEAVNVIGRHLR